MEKEEAAEIILKDETFLDIYKWEKKHFEAYDIYLKDFLGLPFSYRRKVKKQIKLARKEKKKVQINIL